MVFLWFGASHHFGPAFFGILQVELVAMRPGDPQDARDVVRGDFDADLGSNLAIKCMALSKTTYGELRKNHRKMMENGGLMVV